MRPAFVKWYGTRRWRRKARLQLSSHPLCAICLNKGLVEPATVADHVVPHKGNEGSFWFGRLQSLCTPCHEAVKKHEEMHGFRAEIGDDGYPLDPKHPTYQH